MRSGVCPGEGVKLATVRLPGKLEAKQQELARLMEQAERQRREKLYRHPTFDHPEDDDGPDEDSLRWSRGAASADAMSAVKKDMKDMATSVNVGLANLQKPSTQKSLKAKIRARLHFVVALVGLGVVAAVGTYVAKRGLPDIDPVKVRGREGDDEAREQLSAEDREWCVCCGPVCWYGVWGMVTF